MRKVSLLSLRRLRERSKKLLEHVRADLKPFVKDDGTFRRKPDSPSVKGDVNVTTTCSCLMSLALTNKFRDFYKKRKPDDDTPEDKAAAIVELLMEAPWMSSGLTANNAFTTTLVLRTFGFLLDEGLLASASGDTTSLQSEFAKTWELQFGLTDVRGLAKALKNNDNPASEFLWLSLGDKTREQVSKALQEMPNDKIEKKLKAALATDLHRITQSGWIYSGERFARTSPDTKIQLDQKPTGYKLAEVNHLLLIDHYPKELAPRANRTLKEIAQSMATNADNFSINEYPPSATVMYWFVDGVRRAKTALEPGHWNVLCTWAAKQFNHERSLVVARHDAMMDPIAMAMSACLCARLRAISDEAALGTTKEHLAILPSVVELERSIAELFSQQTDSGIWNKYFPIFHYQDAGSNFCFTFELLEAVLCEFSADDNKLLNSPFFIEGLEKAVTWCENNRLACSDEAGEYTGWNSGGYLDTLTKSQPESWATAVVHMFLSELTTVISHRIQREVLRKYNAKAPKDQPNRKGQKSEPLPYRIDELLEIDIRLGSNKVRSLSSVLKTTIIDSYRGTDEASLRRESINQPLSALLFGPPGTSKTRITKAVADDLGWPMVEITPSDFVKGTLANVYLQADKIFDDLMDLSGVVILFDEMDALVQTRDGEIQLDITSQFLTTAMLPKLTRLHDQGRVVFFMATNFQERFDAAIKRAGRFDLLLCMGPPKLAEKLDRLQVAYSLNDKADGDQAKKAGQLIKEYIKKTPELRDQLELYTFGEYMAFLRILGNKKPIGDCIEEIGAAEFRRLLRESSESVTLKLTDLEPLHEFIGTKTLAELKKKTFTWKAVEKEFSAKNIPMSHAVRYLCDWQQSKEQY
jgi:hypothetical protein